MNSTARSENSSPEAQCLADQPPRSIAPVPQLSSKAFTLALLAVCIIPLAGLTLYATLYGRAAEKKLPVEVAIEQRVLPMPSGERGALVDVVVIKNLADFDIPNVTIDLNGQYFLYRDPPLAKAETLVLPQSVFMTKSSQRFAPGRYPITEVTVTGKLPSNARGVTEMHFGG
ncbi:hypothetical protein Q31b_12760 [Novipirellula aureliae]|uniref:Uncharacterized protein n=1 Tax=Novipirellula aureliae TaxID=2527966 RepID=A0A5C6E8E8_9BACT|nr:hypothetical protein [Novipirellula aureliae]TWU43746.1 hypothetical protein Q31b_12760 [Novipirellula aureliae]